MSVKETLLKRASYRKYNDTPIHLEEIKETLFIAQRTASSKNGQFVSTVILNDKEILKEVNKICGNQEAIATCQYLIVFVVDYNRASPSISAIDALEEIDTFTTANINVGLIAQSTELLLQELGYGTCFIGSIRQDLLKIRELLNIEGNAYPILGLTVGNYDEQKVNLRPRVTSDSFYFHNKYSIENVKIGAFLYDASLKKWWQDSKINHESYFKKMEQSLLETYSRVELDQYHKLGFLQTLKKEK